MYNFLCKQATCRLILKSLIYRTSHKEIAAQLGINERSSASQLARAKASLAEQVRAWMKANR